jgi:leucine-rich repeat protein SHOC2
MDEFTIEGNCVSQLPVIFLVYINFSVSANGKSKFKIKNKDGLLSSLTNLSSITLARNQFGSFPLGGPTQFTSVHVIKIVQISE